MTMATTKIHSDKLDSLNKYEPSLSDFSTFSKGSIKYIDKTKFIKTLVGNSRVIFLRPRRFGKSLTLSMLKSFWNGHTYLFENCDVYNEEIGFHQVDNFIWSPSNPAHHNFPPCPIIHLDFSKCNPSISFEATIESQLNSIAKSYGITETSPRDSSNLDTLLTSLCQLPWNRWGKCALLIDEYDNALDSCNIEKEKEILEAMASFFRKIKSADSMIVYAYVTGVSSYGLSGLMAGANNFCNLSLKPELDTLCGFTKLDVASILDKNIDSDNEELEALRKAYNGYTWDINVTNATPRVYNPFEIVTYATEKLIAPYFCVSSSESIRRRFPELVYLKVPIVVLKRRLYKPLSTGAVPNTQNLEYQDDEEPVGVLLARHLLEIGYLTIKSPSTNTDYLILDYPNESVAEYMTSELAALMKPKRKENILNFNSCEDLSSLFELANDVSQRVPSGHRRNYDYESGWHILLVNILTVLKAKFILEEGSPNGFSDLIIESPKFIFVLEIKKLSKPRKVTKKVLEKLCDDALTQIDDREYTKNSSFIRDLISKGREKKEIIEVGLVASDRKFEAFSYRQYGSVNETNFKIID